MIERTVYLGFVSEEEFGSVPNPYGYVCMVKPVYSRVDAANIARDGFPGFRVGDWCCISGGFGDFAYSGPFKSMVEAFDYASQACRVVRFVEAVAGRDGLRVV